MPTIIIPQQPSNQFDMAYGPNAVTLSGITTLEDKYVLRIFRVGQVDPVADLRQSPNINGLAIFDIQNILQTMVQPGLNNPDAQHANTFAANSRLRIANGEWAEYTMQVGYELDGIVTITSTSPVKDVIGGKKQYFEIPFNALQYWVNAQAPSGTTTITKHGRPLSDNQWVIGDTQVSTQDDFEQNSMTSPNGIDVHNVYLDDQCTKSFYNFVNTTGPNPPATSVRGLEGFIVDQYDSAGIRVQYDFVANTQQNGGGPNTIQAQGTLVTGAYQFITAATGPANLMTSLNPATDHYYIVPVLGTGVGGNYMEEAAWRAQRYNILREPCNDYSHIQFAWMNSLGFRDQFTFTKKWERTNNMQRNTFLKEAADYNSTSYNVNVQARGFTTYSQTIKENYVATSGFMNDQEAKLLESLFLSADVMVRFSNGELANQWQPINITSANYVEKTNRKDGLFQYTVNFKMANNIKSQRG